MTMDADDHRPNAPWATILAAATVAGLATTWWLARRRRLGSIPKTVEMILEICDSAAESLEQRIGPLAPKVAG